MIEPVNLNEIAADGAEALLDCAEAGMFTCNTLAGAPVFVYERVTPRGPMIVSVLGGGKYQLEVHREH